MGSAAIASWQFTKLRALEMQGRAVEDNVNLAHSLGSSSAPIAQGTVLGQITSSGLYTPYSSTDVVAPAVKPTMGSPASSDGTLEATNWFFVYTFQSNSIGETTPSPSSDAVAVSATNHVPTPSLTGIPAGVTHVNWYGAAAPAAGAPAGPFQFLAQANVTSGSSGTFNITAPPAAGAAQPPAANTLIARQDGSGIAKAVLAFPGWTDSTGLFYIGATTRVDEAQPYATVYFRGGGARWAAADFTGLDATAAAQLGMVLTQGDLSTGILSW